MAAGNGGIDSQLHELYARAQAARRQSRDLAAQHRVAQQNAAEILQRLHAAWDRAEHVHELWLSASSRSLRYSAYARLHARLASLPVIEQAKGIIMAECGWPEDQAFDALRRASQRENIKVRDLAAKLVATTAQSPSARSRSARLHPRAAARTAVPPHPAPTRPPTITRHQ
jgi:uncharacterized protein (DUF3084 family)